MANYENPKNSTGNRNPPNPSIMSQPDISVQPDTPNRSLHDRMQANKSKNNTNKPRRLRPHERVAQTRTNLEELFETKNFIKFFLIKASNEDENLSNINVIKANKELIQCMKGNRPKKVDELKNGSLLIEVSTEEQSLLLMNLSILDDINVTVCKHPSLNQVKGTIYYRNRCGYTEAEIKEELMPYGVSHVYRTSKKSGDEVIYNNIYIITFERITLPEEVTIGWNKCKVQEYIPRPRRCFKCQGFNHGSKNCRMETPICVNCGQESHGKECLRPPSCKNCDGNHPASSNQCFYYKLSKEIITLQTKEKLSFRDAKTRAMRYMTKPDKLYSTVTATPPSVKRTTYVPQILLSQQAESSREKKRGNTDNSEDPSTIKKLKPQTMLPPEPPVSNQSQGIAGPSQNIASITSHAPPPQNFGPYAPRRAAVVAAQRITSSVMQPEIPGNSMEVEQPLQNSQIIKTSRTSIKSRSESRERPENPDK